MNVAKVQQYGCAALGRLCDSCIMTCDGIDCIVAAMQHHYQSRAFNCTVAMRCAHWPPQRPHTQLWSMLVRHAHHIDDETPPIEWGSANKRMSSAG